MICISIQNPAIFVYFFEVCFYVLEVISWGCPFGLIWLYHNKNFQLVAQWGVQYQLLKIRCVREINAKKLNIVLLAREVVRLGRGDTVNNATLKVQLNPIPSTDMSKIVLGTRLGEFYRGVSRPQGKNPHRIFDSMGIVNILWPREVK